MTISPPKMYAEVLRGDFNAFVHRSFLELNGSSAYLSNWHLEVLAAKLEDVRHGRCRRLIINIPPRHLKPRTGNDDNRLASRRDLRVIRRARGQRHVRDTGILIRARRHARAIGDEDVPDVPHLVVRIEHRRLRIAPHAGGAHFVIGVAGGAWPAC